MENPDVVAAIEGNQPAHRRKVEPTPATEPQPDYIRADQFFQRPICSCCAQVGNVSVAREAVHQVEGHTLSAADSEGINQMHDSDTAHARTSSGCRSTA